MKQQFTSISQETIDDYAAKNAKSHQLTNSFDLKLKYTLAPKEKIEQIFRSGLSGGPNSTSSSPILEGISGCPGSASIPAIIRRLFTSSIVAEGYAGPGTTCCL